MRKILLGLVVSAPLLFAQQAPRVLSIQDLFTRNVGNTEQQNKQVPFEDVKILLGSHAHGDHQEDDGLVMKLTGARAMAMAEGICLQSI